MSDSVTIADISLIFVHIRRIFNGHPNFDKVIDIIKMMASDLIYMSSSWSRSAPLEDTLPNSWGVDDRTIDELQEPINQLHEVIEKHLNKSENRDWGMFDIYCRADSNGNAVLVVVDAGDFRIMDWYRLKEIEHATQARQDEPLSESDSIEDACYRSLLPRPKPKPSRPTKVKPKVNSSRKRKPLPAPKPVQLISESERIRRLMMNDPDQFIEMIKSDRKKQMLFVGGQSAAVAAMDTCIDNIHRTAVFKEIVDVTIGVHSSHQHI